MNNSKSTNKDVGENKEDAIQNTSSEDTNSDQNNQNTSNGEENHQNQEHLEDDIQDEVKDLKDQLLRALAENENLRKRTSKEIDQIKKYGHINLLRELLSVVDNLERAVKSSISDNQSGSGVKNLIDGIEIVLKEMNSLLKKNQIKKIEPLHEKFDYNFHQAMFETPTNDKEPGIVVEVSQKGYTLHDRLVRPAMVGISKKPDETKKDKQKKEID